DPAVAPRVITGAEFDQAFTGVVLTLQPGPDFKRGGAAPSLAAGLHARLRAFQPALLAIVVVGFLMLVPGLVIPGLQRAFTDFYLVAGLHDWLTWLIGAMLAAAAVRMLLTFLQHHLLAR